MARFKLATGKPDWPVLLADVAKLLVDAETMLGDNQKAFFSALETFLDQIEAAFPGPVADAAYAVKRATPTSENPTARDWSGFFAALASFLAAIMPLITPLFTKPE